MCPGLDDNEFNAVVSRFRRHDLDAVAKRDCIEGAAAGRDRRGVVLVGLADAAVVEDLARADVERRQQATVLQEEERVPHDDR